MMMIFAYALFGSCLAPHVFMLPNWIASIAYSLLLSDSFLAC